MNSALTSNLPLPIDIFSDTLQEYILHASWILLIDRHNVTQKTKDYINLKKQIDRYNNPVNKCTKLCYKGNQCPNINGFLNCRYLKCTFAHNSSELRQEECWFNGRCTNLNCNRYHSEPRYCRRCGDVLSKNCRCN